MVESALLDTRAVRLVSPWLAAVAVTLAATPAAAVLGYRLRAAMALDRARSPDEIAAACQLDPRNDACAALLARRREELGLEALEEWRHAVELNPRRGSTLAQAALAAEASGDLKTAEQWLLQAARYNRLWLPRWSLANFYSRYNRTDEFRHWARLAFERGYGDRVALLRLCRQAGLDDHVILDQILPHDHANLDAFLKHLLAEQRLDALSRAADAYLAAGRAPRDAARQVLGAVVHALLEAGQAAPATQLWSRLASAGLLDTPVWTTDQPLTNPTLEPPLPAGAFDWRIPAVPGIETLRGTPRGGIKFHFSGRQPESAELLSQILILRGGRTWTLEFECETLQIPPPNGIEWRLTTLDSRHIITPKHGSSGRSVSWTLPPGDHLLRLALTLHRPTGRARIEGELRLRNLSLKSSGATQ